MAIHNLEISTENLLGVVARMPETEFNRFVESAQRLRRRSSAPRRRWTKLQVELINRLNKLLLAPEKQTRFDKLVAKRRAEKISADELKELVALNEESEALNVERIKILSKLAAAKNKTVFEVMEDLEISPPEAI